eukprot:578334-Rhodomonas_salina.1
MLRAVQHSMRRPRCGRSAGGSAALSRPTVTWWNRVHVRSTCSPSSVQHTPPREWHRHIAYRAA